MRQLAEPETVGDLVDQLPPVRQQIAPATGSAVTPMQMLQIAVERGAQLDMLERLMALQERWEAGEARKAFVAALNAFKANPPTVVKNKRAGFESRRTGDKTEYEYATLDRLCDVIGAALADHDLSHRWEVEQADGLIRVTCILTHAQGHSERVMLQAGADQSGSKNSIQAIGSTVTYLERYTLLSVTGLAAKGQDNDAALADDETISPEQKETLVALMKETGADTAKFLAYLGVTTLDELPASMFPLAKSALQQKKAKAK